MSMITNNKQRTMGGKTTEKMKLKIKKELLKESRKKEKKDFKVKISERLRKLVRRGGE